jgi:hypothetical protein
MTGSGVRDRHRFEIEGCWPLLGILRVDKLEVGHWHVVLSC